MSLRTLPTLEQRSEEWYGQRRGMVTASVVGQLITPSTLRPAANDTARGLVATLVAERITGWTDPTFTSDDMLRGILAEPLARDAYAAHRGVEVAEVGFMVRDDWGFSVGYSPDGLVGDDGLIEIKAPRAKVHLATILADEVPAAHMAQIQCGLLVSGRAWCDFVSFCGGMPLWVRRVEADQRWADAIVAAVTVFEETAAQMVADYRQAIEGLPMTERMDDLGLVF
ncbi:MAG: lambda exonuclease family protein [Nocardioides sp.]